MLTQLLLHLAPRFISTALVKLIVGKIVEGWVQTSQKCELCVQGWYAAFGMFGIAAANHGKAKEAADLAAELVHMGWGVLVSHFH